MSKVTVRKILKPQERDQKKILQACRIGGSIYGKTSPGKSAAGRGVKDDISSNYKNFYRNQVTIMNKVFEKNTK